MKRLFIAVALLLFAGRAIAGTISAFPITTDAVTATQAEVNALHGNTGILTGGPYGNVSNSGTPTQYQWPQWNSATGLTGNTVTASHPVCAGTNSVPQACTNLTDVAIPTGTFASQSYGSTAVGDLLIGGAAGVPTGKVADVAAGQPLLSGGATTAPAYAGYTFSGTAAQTYTFPGATATLVPATNPQLNTTPTSGYSGSYLTTSTLTASKWYTTNGGSWVLADNAGTPKVPAMCYTVSATQCLYSGVIYSASHGFTIGAPIYLSTAGGMTTTAPSTTGYSIQRLGMAVDANTILLMVSPDVGTVQ